MKESKQQFSLIELFLIMAIFAAIASMLMPSLKKIHNSAQNLGCMQNLKQIAIGQFSFMADRNGLFHAVHYPRSLLKVQYYPKGLTRDRKIIERANYHEDGSGYLEPYLGKAKVNGYQDSVYNCPGYVVNPESHFAKQSKSGESTYTGFSAYYTPLNIPETYYIGQANVGRPGPGFIADQLIKPMAWDYFRMRPGWNNTIGSTIHNNTGELPVVFFDGHAKVCYFPTNLWELPGYSGQRRPYYRAWYD